MSLSNYPPGHPFGTADTVLEFKCVNADCESYDDTWCAPAVIERETNSCTLVDEDEGDLCDSCGREGKQV